ncbi:MAG TPA: hypothetical protein VED01_24265 [Burkholderiales bacterium]|nr:hypothetical protein [Burkholderiales bacterium]
MTSDTIRVFVPVGEPAGAQRSDTRSRTSRSESAFVIGLLDNHKHNTDRVLARLEQHFRHNFEGVRFVHAMKGDAGKGAGKALIDDLAAQCDAVVTGIGD